MAFLSSKAKRTLKKRNYNLLIYSPECPPHLTKIQNFPGALKRAPGPHAVKVCVPVRPTEGAAYGRSTLNNEPPLLKSCIRPWALDPSRSAHFARTGFVTEGSGSTLGFGYFLLKTHRHYSLINMTEYFIRL